MKNFLILLCAMLIALTSCNTSPVDKDYKEARSLQKNGQYEVAFNQLAQISIDTDATWQQRCSALFQMSQIEDAVNKDQVAAIKYINKCIEVAAPNEYSFLYAYKGDYSMHYGVPDSAIYYCRKALAMPHDNVVEYVAHYALFNSYEQKGMADSALYHRQLFDEVCKNGKLEAYSSIPDDVFYEELQSKIESQNRSEIKYILYFVILAVVVSVLVICFAVKRWRKKKNETNEPLTDLASVLHSAKQIFEQKESYLMLNELRLKEKDLYKSTFANGDMLEKDIFQSFAEANTVLIDKYGLSADELLCCDCSYMGISNNVIAFVSHSSSAAIRKRKERLRYKLSPSHYSVLFES